MSASAITLSVLILLTVGLIGWTLRRPALSQSLGGKILAFVAFCILPAIVVPGGLTHHFEQAKTTEFCLSCHIMEPYGRSLWVDHGRFIPAVHFQNKQIPRNRGLLQLPHDVHDVWRLRGQAARCETRLA